MKKNKLLFLVITAPLLWLGSCSKKEFVEETENATPPSSIMATQELASTSFKLGVNGHPLGPKSYTSVSAVQQMKILKSMGMNVYRIDVLSKIENGKVAVSETLYNSVIKAAKEANVTLLPMLYPRDLNLSMGRTEAYARGRRLAEKFAANYKDDFDYYNLGNELDTWCLLSPTMSGTLPSHYDIKKFNVIASYLTGMNDGIKKYDPTAKTIINTTWMHYEYLKMLERYGTKFDIVGYQWYDDHEKTAKANHNISDITQFLATKFSKPIWFTEIGFRNKDGLRSDADQKTFLNSFITKCRNNSRVKAAIIYELFNEPEKKHALESHFGIYKWSSPYTSFAPKLYASETAASL